MAKKNKVKGIPSTKFKPVSPEEERENAKKKDKEEQEERTGIIPEGMDFKKFLGCGG